MLQGKKIIIGITGSIAAFKIPHLIRLLRKQEAEVQVIMTPAALDFVTPLTLSTLSGKPVLIGFFKTDDGLWNSHIELAAWADVMMIAPASANTIGKIAAGLADNLMLAVYLAARCPVFLVPAMDADMYLHPSTQSNLTTLRQYGARIIDPVEGELASGLHGAGRMREPEEIVRILNDHFEKKNSFRKTKVLISAGPTHEPIDPVRYITNHSTGKMGYALAESFADRGADVILVSGPVSLEISHPNIRLIRVNSAAEMKNACSDHFAGADVIVMAAAVSDYRPESFSPEKIKKTEKILEIRLVKNDDILSWMGETAKRGQVLVGFALETTNELLNARKKLKAKKLDMIVLNSLRDQGAGFGHDTNRVTLISRKGDEIEIPLKTKKQISEDIVNFIGNWIHTRNLEE
ncbi:MAG: bifunctional phosphopantothenoylcysteine decarboxylase/phosphopantothenate--cysteine ligase CoaBC [Bacteroidales bacterium]|nr:bifunctional phosphopantothenoylcysteine decarboxylase/phosphopantothenate--cysteine ligase CoaBC [Bacteroidales bacterium]